jgi:molybdate transport system permease protein
MKEMISWNGFLDPILLSIKIACVASIIVFVLGVLAAWFMRKSSFRGKTIVETLFMLPLVLPPTVVGFILLILLGRNSWFGRFIEFLFQQPLIFTWYAGVMAAVVVAFPLVYQAVKVGFQSIDKDIEDAGRSSGANEWQVFRWITLPLTSRALISAFILGFARGLGEFGATLMIAGNIPGKTQTIPTAIYIAVDSGNLTLAWLWCISIIAISFLMLISVNRIRA